MSRLPIFNAQEPYEALLASAEVWHEQDQYKEAVIMAQTSLELFTEKVLGHLYKARNIEYLKPAFESLLINYNIGNSKVSRLYMALSEDSAIKQQPFWSAIADHVQLRNDLVHEGQDASEEQSRRSLDAVRALIAHIKDYNSMK
jgi:hypothetical protein